MEKSHILSANPVVITSLKSCAPLKEDDHIDGREGCVLALTLEDSAAARSLFVSLSEIPLLVPPFPLENPLSLMLRGTYERDRNS